MRTALLILACALPAAAESPSAWLDKAVSNWNKAGAAPPAATKAAEGPEARCGSALRPATAKEDKLVTAAGWFLVGAMQVFGRTRALLATAGVDGMCRPEGFQGFVFVDGRFAGTLAPQPMRARSDGTLSAFRLVSEQSLSADFARYLDQDPLCCPSRTSSVRYRIDTVADEPLVVPLDVSTAAR
jgi:hypothetical protein